MWSGAHGKDGTLVLLSDVHAQPMIALGCSWLLDEIGDERIFGNVDDALNYARRELGVPEEAPPLTAEPTVARERTSALAEAMAALGPQRVPKGGEPTPR